MIEHLLPAVLHEYLPYSKHAAKALLRAPLEPEEKFSVAVRLVGSYEKSSAAVDVVLAEARKSFPKTTWKRFLRPFVSMALGPPPGMHLGGSEPIELDTASIRSLFQKRRGEICAEVDALLSDANPEKIGAAVEIILATDSDELLSRRAPERSSPS